jgi:hypothetical protein
MSLSVTASERTSSLASGTGRSDGTPVSVTRAAPRRSRAIGRSVDPTASQMAPVNSTNSSGVPNNSALATTDRLPETELYGTAAMTMFPPEARIAVTRSWDGSP